MWCLDRTYIAIGSDAESDDFQALYALDTEVLAFLSASVGIHSHASGHGPHSDAIATATR